MPCAIRRIDVKTPARALDERVHAAAARVARRRHASAHLAGRRSESHAVRGADRRAGSVSDRTLRDELSHERTRSAAHAGAARYARPLRSSSPIRCSANRRGRGRAGRDVALARRSVTSGAALSRLYFAPLSGSAAEARTIKALFPDATLLTGQSGDQGGGRAGEGAAHPAHRLARILSERRAGHRPPRRIRCCDPAWRWPAATSRSGDGILTALEASGLDLWGTKLVTLSACDTGVGEIRNHEGVYGLRRAFVLAGAETLVMSLWPVSDYITRDAMVGYYTRLRAGLGRGDALRQAKLAILKRRAGSIRTTGPASFSPASGPTSTAGADPSSHGRNGECSPPLKAMNSRTSGSRRGTTTIWIASSRTTPTMSSFRRRSCRENRGEPLSAPLSGGMPYVRISKPLSTDTPADVSLVRCVSRHRQRHAAV